jgi:hypothetical protein
MEFVRIDVKAVSSLNIDMPSNGRSLVPYLRVGPKTYQMSTSSMFRYPDTSTKSRRLSSVTQDEGCDTTGHPAIFVSSMGTYTAQFMPYWPSISTCTLVSGWNDQTTIHFIDAVEEVIRRNPVLTGKAIKTSFPVSTNVST